MSAKLQDWTVLSMLEWGTGYFKKQNIPEARLSIEWLLADVLQLKRLDLYLQFDRPLSSAELASLRPLIKRRAGHEPLQYITGISEFMHARIIVNPHVLIPRIETEQLVEIVLDEHPRDATFSVLDIGTGSGCIPIALKMERPAWNISALDISSDALVVARKNAEQNETDISFLEADITRWQAIPFDAPFDLIISNPPYVLPREKMILEPQVREHEPSLALFCDDMENMYKSIIACSLQNLTEGGTLYLEIHEKHAELILSLFDPRKWQANLLHDYNNKPRFIAAGLKK